MDFINFFLNWASWSFWNGALQSWIVLFLAMMLAGYLISLIITNRFSQSKRRMAMIAVPLAWLALLCVSWGFLEDYTFHLEAARHGCSVENIHELKCQQLPQLP